MLAGGMGDVCMGDTVGCLCLWVVAAVLAAVHFAVQVLVPLRHLAIPSNSVWSEEGSAGRG